MNKQNYHKKLTNELHDIYVKKNADYGDSFSKTFKDLGIVSATTRICDKTNRLISLSKKMDSERLVRDEKIEDTLMDLANYCLLTLIEMKDKSLNSNDDEQLK